MNFGKVFTSKCVGTGPSSYKKRIYRAAVSQRLRNTALDIFEGLSARSSAFLIFHGLTQTPIPLLRHEAGSISSLINSRTVRRHVIESVVKYTTESNLEEVEHNVTYSVAFKMFVRNSDKQIK